MSPIFPSNMKRCQEMILATTLLTSKTLLLKAGFRQRRSSLRSFWCGLPSAVKAIQLCSSARVDLPSMERFIGRSVHEPGWSLLLMSFIRIMKFCSRLTFSSAHYARATTDLSDQFDIPYVPKEAKPQMFHNFAQLSSSGNFWKMLFNIVAGRHLLNVSSKSK